MGIYAIAKNEDDVNAAENNESITRSGGGFKSHPLNGVVCILDCGSDIIRSRSLLIYWKPWICSCFALGGHWHCIEW